MKVSPLLFLLMGLAATAAAETSVVCTYAPSQSSKIAGVVGVATGGAAATAGAVAAATGLTAVVHGSGAYILTGSGYIAGTIGGTGAAVAAAPFIVGAGILVGGAAVTVELVCAKRNHPEQVARVQRAAQEFEHRFRGSMDRAKAATIQTSKTVGPAIGEAASMVKSISGDVWRYAFRELKN